jgi:hypothetical protein
MIVRYILILLLLSTSAEAQNTYFFGLDIGPKYDQYVLGTAGTRPYDPSLNIRDDVGALFGISFGVLLNDHLMLESGIYRSNFRAIFDIVNDDKKEYFVNTPVNTFTANMVPVSLYVRKPFTRTEGAFIHFGGGFSTLLGTKKGLEEMFFSHAEPIDPEDLNKGTIAYTILNNKIDANIITINLSSSIHYPVNEAVAASVTVLGRLGIAGSNSVNIEHSTPNHSSVRNRFYTKGSGVQLQFGFRYFFTKY